MINTAIRERKEKIVHKGNLNVDMRPEFVAALDQC
jgi:hypothetical protein